MSKCKKYHQEDVELQMEEWITINHLVALVNHTHNHNPAEPLTLDKPRHNKHLNDSDWFLSFFLLMFWEKINEFK